MEFKQLMTRLEVDSLTLTRIEDAYSATSPSRIVLLQSDERAFVRTVLALRDLFKDVMPGEEYGDQIEKLFQLSLMNSQSSPSQEYVRDINDMIATIIARLRRLGEIPNQLANNHIHPIPINTGFATGWTVLGLICIAGLLLTLGFQLAQTNSALAYPDKITAAWLWENVPVSFWMWAAGLLATAFALGVMAGQIDWVKKFLHRK